MTDGTGSTRRLVMIAGTDPSEEVSGHRTYVQAHALAAAAAGFSPDVFFVGRSTGTERTDFGTLHQIASPLRPPTTFAAAAHQPFLVSALKRHLAPRQGPHLIHSFGAWANTGVTVARALARRGVTAIPIANAYTTLAHEMEGKLAGLATEHGRGQVIRYWLNSLWVRAVADRNERLGYQRSRLILVNYDSVRELVENLCGPGVEIRRIPYAAPAAFRRATSGERALVPEPIGRLQPASAPLIVSVSRHDPRKGLHIFLHALAGLAEAGIEFRACLVGPGPLLDAHRRLAAKLQLSQRIAITGTVENVFPYLQNAEVFVLPSLEEGSGSVSLLEALQAGTAVVASRLDGIPEDIVDERDALLVPPGEVQPLQAALGRLLGDRRLREALKARAQRVYEQNFSAEALVSALSQAYGDLGFTV